MPPVKIHDEVIAREIIINDADPGVRYKLTKRQTQEEVRVLLPWEELTDSFTRKAWCVVKLSLL
jgi:hypothetical protein